MAMPPRGPMPDLQAVREARIQSKAAVVGEFLRREQEAREEARRLWQWRPIHIKRRLVVCSDTAKCYVGLYEAAENIDPEHADAIYQRLNRRGSQQINGHYWVVLPPVRCHGMDHGRHDGN